MKKLVVACAISASVLFLTSCGGDNADPDVVVETEAGNISKEDFYEALKDRYGEEVLYDLVTTEVLSNNFDVTEEDVEEEINLFKDQLGEEFEMWLMQEGFADEEELAEVINISLLQEAAITKDIEVTDEEIEEYYNKVKVELEARHILVEDPELAEEIKQELDEGADFAELAKEHSSDGSAEEGGALGYFSQDSNMVPEFLDAAYELEVDEISSPVQSQFGFHIIQVTDIRDKEDFDSLEDMKSDITRTLKTAKVDPAEAQGKVRTILDDAKIEIKIEEFKDLFEESQAQG